MNNSTISSRAIISKSAELGNNVTIGDYCSIGPDVKIGNNVQIGNNVIIEGNTIIDDKTKIFHFSVIGTPPQDIKFDGEKSYLHIGKNNVIREFCTIHLATNEKRLSFKEALKSKEGITFVGNDNFIMIGSHIAHNCIVGNNVIFANNVSLAGHCIIKDFANIGAYVMIHQFTQIGEYSMIGSGFRVSKDVVPYALAAGYDFKIVKVNSIGLKRKGFTHEEINSIKKIFKIIFWSNNNVTQSLEKIQKITDNKFTGQFIEFINNSKRGITK